MPKYAVIITRDITESTVVEVEADNHDDAEEVAITTLRQQESTEWKIDDGSWNHSNPYATDVSKVLEYEVEISDATGAYVVRHVPTNTLVDGRFDEYDNAQMWADALNGGD